jgi:Family of unknown function (DUF6152)
MKTKLLMLFFAAWLRLALAHHSTAMFDMDKPTTIKGTVKTFEWANPHVYLHLDVVNAEGKLEESVARNRTNSTYTRWKRS